MAVWRPTALMTNGVVKMTATTKPPMMSAMLCRLSQNLRRQQQQQQQQKRGYRWWCSYTDKGAAIRAR
jgi:hypothetical protein